MSSRTRPKAKLRWRAAIGACALAPLLLVELGCAHVVQVQTKPAGATIYVNGRRIGKAPVAFEEEGSDKTRETVVIARLNGYETTEIKLLRSEPNPWAVWMLTPFCGTLGWAAAAASLLVGVVACIPTAGCTILIGAVPAALMTAAGCAWILATSPTWLLLNHTRQLPDTVMIDLPPTGTLNQSDDGSELWPPPFVDSPEEDNYWQNPKPRVEEKGLPPPTQPAAPASPSSIPSTMNY